MTPGLSSLFVHTWHSSISLFVVLVLPGFAACFFLFSHHSVTAISRLFISLSLSIVISCLTCVFLLRMFGNLNPSQFVAIIVFLSVLFLLVGIIRWRQSIVILATVNFSIKYFLEFTRKIAAYILPILFISFILSIGDRVVPRGLTELYFLDPRISMQSQMNDQAITILFGVHNLEGHQQEYEIETLIDGHIISRQNNIILNDNQQWQGSIPIDTGSIIGEHLLEVKIFKEHNQEVSANIKLWLQH